MTQQYNMDIIRIGFWDMRWSYDLVKINFLFPVIPYYLSIIHQEALNIVSRRIFSKPVNRKSLY